MYVQFDFQNAVSQSFAASIFLCRDILLITVNNIEIADIFNMYRIIQLHNAIGMLAYTNSFQR